MSELAPFSLKNRNPDVLTCIANLSNDEVFTPPEFAGRMLDTLADAWSAAHNGENIWANSKVTFLDPFTKSGVFLREIVERLTEGLADHIIEWNNQEKASENEQSKTVHLVEFTPLSLLFKQLIHLDCLSPFQYTKRYFFFSFCERGLLMILRVENIEFFDLFNLSFFVFLGLLR
jgi:hypothetical protein